MTTATLLHVGDDICHRIPVMERAGLIVSRSEASMSAVQSALTPGDEFAAITFHNDVKPVSSEVVYIARQLSVAPIVFFENQSVDREDCEFDLVIRDYTPPAVWVPTLVDAIEQSRKIREISRQLRLDAAAVRSQSRELLRKLAEDCSRSVDLRKFWHADTD